MQQNTDYRTTEDLRDENGKAAVSPDAPAAIPISAEKAGSAAADGAEADTGLEISLPLSQLNEDELKKIRQIVDSKQTVLKKALETDTLPIVIKEETVSFPWFTLHGRDGELDAYQRLVFAIVKYAKEHSRVKETELVSDNDKYVMRMFLIRLGFNGEENKAARRLLLSKLHGNSSWKSGKAPAKVKKEEKA